MAGILIVLTCWPLVAGMVVVNDDLKFVRSTACDLPVADHMRQMWASQSFRPLEILAGRMCDPETLRCTGVVLIHLTGLAVALLAVCALARIILPTERRLAPLAILLLALSPPTTTSIWQVDTCSQTWSVALGLWSCVLAWRGFHQAQADRWPWMNSMLLACCFVVSALIKETAFGWSLSIGLCGLGGAAVLLRQNRMALLRFVPIVCAVIAVPLLLLAVRLGAGALAHEQGSALDNPYKLELGINVPMNALMATMGATATGPFHLITSSEAPIVLRSLPAVAFILLGLIGVTAVEFGFLRGRDEDRIACRRSVLLLLATSGSAAITCLMQSVSDLYCFGFNAGFALLTALAVLLVIRACETGACAKSIGAAVKAAFVLSLAIGAFGLAGRAAHFRSTWIAVARTNEAVIRAADAWVADSSAKRGFRAADDQLEVCFGPACRPGSTYGQYVCSIMQGIDWDLTADWLRRRDPQLRLGVRTDLDCSLFSGSVFAVECPADPFYGNW